MKMNNSRFLLILMLFLLSCKEEERTPIVPKPFFKEGEARVIFHPNRPSAYVNSRHVDVWIPSNYDPNASQKYKVLYMHDGQNAFNPATSYAGVDWGVDEALDQLIKEGKVPPTIVVAIWNTPLRFPEYMPQVPKSFVESPDIIDLMTSQYGTPVISDNYLKFIVTELKPFIDANYNTSTKREDTFIMGSSMGGLISLYAISEYPEVFGGAGCVSTHWPVWTFSDAYMGQVEENLPDPSNHKLYFDFGTVGLDAKYEPYQNDVDKMMERRGYDWQINWITRKFVGADHNEQSWNERVHIPLEFLLAE